MKSQPSIKHKSKSDNPPIHCNQHNLQDVSNNSKQLVTIDTNLYSSTETKKAFLWKSMTDSCITK